MARPPDKWYSSVTGSTIKVLAPLVESGGVVRLCNDIVSPVTKIDRDTGLSSDSDTILPTQHAVKTYVDSTVGGAITPPLVLSSATPFQLQLKQTGHAGSTTFGHTATDDTEISDTNGIRFPSGTMVQMQDLTDSISPTQGGVLRLAGGLACGKRVWATVLAAVGTAENQLQLLYDALHTGSIGMGANGFMTLNSSHGAVQIDSSDVLNVLSSEAASNSTTGALRVTGGINVGAASQLVTTTFTAANPQIKLAPNLLVSATLGCDVAGQLNLAATGASVAVDASSVFKIANATASSGFGTGALQVTGGISTSAQSWFPSLRLQFAGANQLIVAYDAGNYSAFTTSATGELTIDTSGNQVYFAANDSVKVLKTTAATDLTTGALVVAGGISASARSWLAGVSLMSTTANQLFIRYDPTYYAYVDVSSAGVLSMGGNGSLTQIDSTNVLKVLKATEATSFSTGALQVAGGIAASAKSWLYNTVMTSTISPQLILQNSDPSNVGFTCTAAGELSIETSGNRVNISSTDIFRLLNNAAATAVSTGSLQIAGGVSAGARSWLAGATLQSTTAYQLIVRYDPTWYATFDVSSAGALSIGTTGARILTAAASVFEVLNVTDATSVTTGGAKFSGGIGVAGTVFAHMLQIDGWVLNTYTIPMQVDSATLLPAFSVLNFLGAWNYSAAGPSGLYGSLTLPRAWRPASTIELIAQCFCTTTAAQSYALEARYALTPDGSVINWVAPTTLGFVTHAAPAVTGDISKLVTLSLGTFVTAIATAEPLLSLRVSRNPGGGTDNYAGSVYVMNVSARIYVDKLGA